MVSMLSFDSRSMEFLLGEDFESFFNEKYPLFYKNKIRKGSNDKYFFRNAV